MNFLWAIQNKLKTSGFLMLCITVFIYFLFYTINGERGIIKYLYLKSEITQARSISDKYKQQKQTLEDKVRLLSSSSLDLDLLEERARVVLNFASQDDFIILDSSLDE